VLLTGDGHADDILNGLRAQGVLAAGGGVHVEVLKVQHHASEHNVHEAFCRAVTADNYVFCGNGEHENPDLRVVDAILDSRVGAPAVLSPNPEANRKFVLWFNSSEAVTPKAPAKEHMRKLANRVAARMNAVPGRFEARFLGAGASSLDLDL